MKFIIAVLVVVLGVLFWWSRRPAPTERPEAKPELMASEQARPAPGFSIPSLTEEGGVIASDSLKGRVVLLDFWATWCPPCRAELPFLNGLYGRLKDRGFAVVGMTVDRGDPRQIGLATRRFGLDYPVGLAGPDVQRQFGGIRAVPTKFLLDREGRVRRFYEGMPPEDALEADVLALLNEG